MFRCRSKACVSVFTDDEAELVEFLLKFARAGFPLCKKKVRILAWEYADINGIKGFSQLSKRGGKDWLKGFLKRHQRLRVKKAKNLSVNRAMCANPAKMGSFFDQYEKVLREMGIDSPDNIWNCDESGVQDIPKDGTYVIGATGEKTFTQVSKEQGETTTVLTYANAAGKVMPPLVIFKGKKIAPEWTTGAPRDATVRCSDTGYINKELFHEYATKWAAYVKKLNRNLDCKKHLLLLDSHKSHIYNYEFLKLMMDNNIAVLAIPAHTSHVVQPLDSSPFANFKTSWNQNLAEYLYYNIGCAMPKQDFWIPFLNAWRKAMTVPVVAAGFRKTGIYPVNRNAVKLSDLGPSSVTDNIAQLAGKTTL